MGSGRQSREEGKPDKPGRGAILLVVAAVLLLAAAVALLVSTPSLDFHAAGG